MNITFKARFLKQWTLYEDKIVYGKEEILIKDIQDVNLAYTASLATNGVIVILVGEKRYNLVYPNKMKAEGLKAFEYLKDNCINKTNSVNKTQKSISSIQEEIKNLPHSDLFGTKKEVFELPNIIENDEKIKALTSGLTDGNTWLIVATNKRIIMLDKGMIYGVKQVDIPLNRINSISHSKGMLLGKISITDGAVTRTIENIANQTISFFCDTVKKEIELSKNAENTINTSNTYSAADEIMKFKELLDLGLLTQEEFNKKKKDILNI
jgi:hypothetical protein